MIRKGSQSPGLLRNSWKNIFRGNIHDKSMFFWNVRYVTITFCSSRSARRAINHPKGLQIWMITYYVAFFFPTVLCRCAVLLVNVYVFNDGFEHRFYSSSSARFETIFHLAKQTDKHIHHNIVGWGWSWVTWNVRFFSLSWVF